MIRAGMKNMFLIIGAIMGAGYASGREIWQFFGPGSGLAIVLFTFLFIFCTTLLLQIGYQLRTTNYLPILYALTGKRMAVLYDYLILVYLFCVTIVMLAGSGATFQSFGMPFWWGLLFIVVALLIIFSKGIGELLSINQWLIPGMIIALFIILLFFIKDQEISIIDQWNSQNNWFVAFPFTALNILPLIAVLGALGSRIQSKGEIYIASVLSGLILGGITYIYNSSLLHLAESTNLPEIPLYAIVRNYSDIILAVMMLVLWLAIYTTAAATLLGMVTRINKRYNYPLIKITAIILCVMLPFTAFGFTRLIAFLYPLYGILNLYLLFQLLIYPLWKKNRN